MEDAANSSPNKRKRGGGDVTDLNVKRGRRSPHRPQKKDCSDTKQGINGRGSTIGASPPVTGYSIANGHDQITANNALGMLQNDDQLRQLIKQSSPDNNNSTTNKLPDDRTFSETPKTPMNSPGFVKLVNPLEQAQTWIPQAPTRKDFVNNKAGQDHHESTRPVAKQEKPNSVRIRQTTVKVGVNRFSLGQSLLLLCGLLLVLISALLPQQTQRLLPRPRTDARDLRNKLRYWGLVPASSTTRQFSNHVHRASHIVPPEHDRPISNITLRDYLMNPEGVHLALSPAFFGFYAYFGALQAWDETLEALSINDEEESDNEENLSGSQSTKDFGVLKPPRLKAVVGASAGAMAAVLLSVGIAPQKAAEFCATVTLDKFADPPGWFAAFKGHKFEQLMTKFIQNEQPNSTLQLEDGIIPVAVTGFDIRTLTTSIMQKGNIALAARASATFPFLFQPAVWTDEIGRTAWLIDGGVEDDLGLLGLGVFGKDVKRVVHLVVGTYMEDGPRGPSKLPVDVHASSVVSINIKNTPRCGPTKLENGPLAVEAARRAMVASMDIPLFVGQEQGHYELVLDASEFVPSSVAS